LNFSVTQNKSIYFPSPCERLSRPRTTTEILPLDRLVGMDSLDLGYSVELSVLIPFCLSALLLAPVSLVPLITLKHFHLDSTWLLYPAAVCCSLKPRLLIGLATSMRRYASRTLDWM